VSLADRSSRGGTVPAREPSDPSPFLRGGAEMAARIHEYDWGGSTLGPLAKWSQPLKTLLGLMLASRQPMFMAWGAERTWFYNDAFIPLLGVKHPDALGKPALQVWDEARQDLAPLFDRVFAGHAVHMGDINLTLDRSGRPEEAHFAFSYTPAYDETGAVAGLFGACIETTEQVLAERARADEAERQRRLFEQAPSFMCIMRGPDHVFEFVNNAHKQLFGSAHWIGRPVRAAFPDIEGQGYFELLDQVYASGRRHIARAAPVHYRRTREGPDESRLLDFIYEPMTDAAGHVTGIFCEGIDVTDTVRTEQALRESEERFREVADAAPVLMWISDTSSGCTWFNKPWLDFTGRRMEQELGHGWADSVHPDDRGRALSTYADAFARRAPLRRDYRLMRHDGAWRIVDSTGVPRFASDRRFLGYVGSCADVTDQRAAEQALRHSEEQLRLATDAAEVGLWDVDHVTDTLFWPPRVKAMFGISPDVPVSMADFYAGLHPDDRDATSAAYAAAADPARRALYDVE
jgi:PAS domain S-box-containing protein